MLLIFLDMSRNSSLEVENKRLSVQITEMKDICSLTSSLNVKYKLQLERETSEKENLQEGNHRMKLKLNEMSAKCNELNQRIKVLESNLKRNSTVMMTQPKVQIIKSVADIVVDQQQSDQALIDLQKRYNELDVEHQEALNVIEDLEFELGDVSLEDMQNST